MRGDDGPGAALEKMRGDGDGQGGAFFGVGGGAKLVEQHQGVVVGEM